MAWYSWFYGSGGDRRINGFQNPKPSRTVTAEPVTFDSAMSVSAFWASARLLTEVVAAMPVKCYEFDEETHVKRVRTDYKLWNLINYKPNKTQTRTEFFESIMLSLVTWGNAYVAVERNSNGEIISLTPLVAAQMQVELIDGGLVYRYHMGDQSIRVYAESSIWHTRLFGNGIIGLSPLGYASTSISIAQAADKRVSKIAATGGKATGILTVDQALTDKQREAIQANFKGLETGNADQLFVLEAGFKYQQTSMSPSDMQLIENRRFQIEDIARFMGVPSVLINDTSASTTWGSGIEQITQGFYKLNLRPYLERIESSLKRHLMPESDWGNISIEFDFDALLRADKSKRIEAASKAVNSGLLTPNEGRAQEGLEGKEGGDDIYLNGTLVPAGTNPNMTANEADDDDDRTQETFTSTD